MGLEPTTFALRRREHRTEPVKPQGLASGGADACTNACNNSPGSPHESTADTADAGPVGEHFAEAVAMLARLPLTDAERAEAVRRLLGATDVDAEAAQDAGQ
ncbi:MAG: hypothetical protein ABII12_05225 [Planctomycetota bacterium]